MGLAELRPDAGRRRLRQALAARFPEAPPAALFNASSAASKIIPQITRFFWKDIDLKWYPEACMHHPGAFYTVKDFIDGQTMPGSGIVNIRTYRERFLGNAPMKGVTPREVADSLEADSAAALRGLERMPEKIADKELRLTVGDLRAMAYLGDYYAEKSAALRTLHCSTRRAIRSNRLLL